MLSMISVAKKANKGMTAMTFAGTGFAFDAKNADDTFMKSIIKGRFLKTGRFR
jgi:hypothetical protein